jgi:hypothetical protein
MIMTITSGSFFCDRVILTFQRVSVKENHIMINAWFITRIIMNQYTLTGQGAMLQAGRSLVRIPMKSLDVFLSILLILPAALWP